MDSDAIKQILSVGGAAWTATAIFALVIVRVWSGLPQLLDKWLAYRSAVAAEKAADWTRLRDEVIRLGEAEQRCRVELAAVMQRLAQLEGFAVGRGEARHEVSIIESATRIIEDKERKE